MEYRILFRFVGVETDLNALWEKFMEHFPEAEFPSADFGEWYSVDEVMMDEYECRFEELPVSSLMAVDGCVFVENDFPEDFFDEIMENFERVYGVFKWSSMDVGCGCGISEGWGEFNPDYMDDASDEANEISEDVLGF